MKSVNTTIDTPLSLSIINRLIRIDGNTVERWMRFWRDTGAALPKQYSLDRGYNRSVTGYIIGDIMRLACENTAFINEYESLYRSKKEINLIEQLRPAIAAHNDEVNSIKRDTKRPLPENMTSVEEILESSAPITDPTPLCGVYFLIKDTEIVYVGRSLNVTQRVIAHKSGDKDFDRYSYVTYEESELKEKESEYIAYLKPKYNIGNDGKFRTSKREIVMKIA